MKNNFKSFLIMIMFFLAGILSSTSAQQLDELIMQGDNSLDVEFDLSKATQIYEKADKMFPNNWEVCWRLSRVYMYAGDRMPDNTSEQKDGQIAVYQKSLSYAEKSIKLAPDKSVTYLRRAIANGKIALFKGVFSVGGIVNSVKADCEKAISLGNGGNFIQALAHYVLARTNAKVSEKWAPARAVLGLGWADNEKAITEYNIAVKLSPEFRMFYVDLARSYIREDEYAKAKEALKKAIACPKKELDDDIQLSDAKSLLEKIKNKS